MLKGPLLEPLHSERPEQLIVCLHGYGSNGEDMASLARLWQKSLPRALFWAPNAPHGSEVTLDGYQWFGIASYDPWDLLKGIKEARATLLPSLEALIEERDLVDVPVAFVGFSQGMMVGLNAALTWTGGAKSVIGYSGLYIHDESATKVAKPDILLVHGEDDPMIAVETLSVAEEELKNQGLNVKTHVCAGLDHSIDEVGMTMGAAFLKATLTPVKKAS